MRAPFIVFEGADGAGTTTQAARLVARLQGLGIPAWGTAEPTHGPIGKLLRAYLRDGARPLGWRGLAHLFAADRCWHVEREVRPRLAQGVTVVCDRFHLSTVVYQGLAEGGDRVRMRALAQEVRAGVPDGDPAPEAPWWVEPDVTLVLDGPADVFWQRVVARGGARDRFEEQAFHTQVVAAYHSFGWDVAIDHRGGLRLVDGAPAPEAVEQACWGFVQRYFYPEVRALWQRQQGGAAAWEDEAIRG
jgi:dTMP kinase